MFFLCFLIVTAFAFSFITNNFEFEPYESLRNRPIWTLKAVFIRQFRGHWTELSESVENHVISYDLSIRIYQNFEGAVIGYLNHIFCLLANVISKVFLHSAITSGKASETNKSVKPFYDPQIRACFPSLVDHALEYFLLLLTFVFF